MKNLYRPSACVLGLGLLALFSLSAPLEAHTRTEYRLFEIGAVGEGEYSFHINDVGGAAGTFARTEMGVPAAFYWSNGRRVEIGTLGGLGRGQGSIAYGLNDLGQVVGESLAADGVAHAFLWRDQNNNGRTDPGDMIDLGAANVPSRAMGINSFGQVALRVQPGGSALSYLWTPQTPNGTLGTSTLVAEGALVSRINDYGQLLGRFFTGKVTNTAFLWTPSAPNTSTGNLISLPTLPDAVSTSPTLLHQNGSVGGITKQADALQHAWVWIPSANNGEIGILTDLVPPGSGAGTSLTIGGVNRWGHVLVNRFQPSQPEAQQSAAFLWKDGSFRALRPMPPNTTGTALDDPEDPEHGVIVGYGNTSGTPQSAFLLDHFGYLPLTGFGSWKLDRAAALNAEGDIAGIGRKTAGGKPTHFMLRPEGLLPPIPPLPPTQVRAYALTDRDVLIHWQDGANNEDGFRLTRLVNGAAVDVQVLPALTGTGTLRYLVVSGLTPATRYTFRLEAFNAGGNTPTRPSTVSVLTQKSVMLSSRQAGKAVTKDLTLTNPLTAAAVRAEIRFTPGSLTAPLAVGLPGPRQTLLPVPAGPITLAAGGRLRLRIVYTPSGTPETVNRTLQLQISVGEDLIVAPLQFGVSGTFR